LAGKKDATVHRFQAVAHIGQRTGNDYRHRIVEIARLHLIDDIDRGDIGRVGENGLVGAQDGAF
jgi:hypothetical protein